MTVPRDKIVSYVAKWKKRAELAAKQLVQWIGIGSSKFHSWKQRYGKANEHNALVLGDHWLEAWEKQAIVAFHTKLSGEGYRRLTYLMMDQDVVTVSPATVYRVLKIEGCFEQFVDDYNHRRSHSAIGYVTPADKLAGREQAIFDERDRKLAEARERRPCKRRQAREEVTSA